mmetsp:Transcript_19549/g.56917  ORF Transcript_19549/g.56917 Transcript_19549/m.56917 type:complete len:242 (-) Transcript_19549:344-1069(-)
MLDIGQRDATPPRAGTLPQSTDAAGERLPCREFEAPVVLPRCGKPTERALVLPPRRRAGVRHQLAVSVAEELALRDCKLHDVTHLAEREPLQEWQLHLHQRLRGREAPTGQRPPCGRIAEILRDLLPHLLGVLVHGAATVHKCGRPAAQQRCPIIGSPGSDHLESSASLASNPQQLEVDRDALVAQHLRELEQPLPQDAAIWTEAVRVQAVHSGCELQGARHPRRAVRLRLLLLAPLMHRR